MNYALYPTIFGKLKFEEMVAVARKHGMTVINAFKVGMCVSASIALHGTERQKRAVVQEWADHGNTLYPKRKRSLYWVINCDIPRERWADVIEAEERMAGSGSV